MIEETTPGIVTKSDRRNIDSYFSTGIMQHFSDGETIINGIDEPRGAYLIKSGFVKSHSTSIEGHTNLLMIHASGEIIPLPWSLDGAYVTGLFYEAMGEVCIIKVSKDKLRIAMGNNTWLTQAILNQTVAVVALYTRRIQVLEFRSARGRIIAELLLLAERFGRMRGGKIVINVPITHQDISDSININRETASRALGVLFEEKLISQDDRLFVIPDIDKLKDQLE